MTAHCMMVWGGGAVADLSTAIHVRKKRSETDKFVRTEQSRARNHVTSLPLIFSIHHCAPMLEKSQPVQRRRQPVSMLLQ